MPQSHLTKFHLLHSAYWEGVKMLLEMRYRRNEQTAEAWATDKMLAIEDENGKPTIPDEPPERMAQEIFTERVDV